MTQTMFHLGDIISTTVLFVIFLAIFFVMIHTIKRMKSTAPSPPQESLQQQVEDLTVRVTILEQQLGNLSERR